MTEAEDDLDPGLLALARALGRLQANLDMRSAGKDRNRTGEDTGEGKPASQRPSLDD